MGTFATACNLFNHKKQTTALGGVGFNHYPGLVIVIWEMTVGRFVSSSRSCSSSSSSKNTAMYVGGLPTEGRQRNDVTNHFEVTSYGKQETDKEKGLQSGGISKTGSYLEILSPLLLPISPSHFLSLFLSIVNYFSRTISLTLLTVLLFPPSFSPSLYCTYLIHYFPLSLSF